MRISPATAKHKGQAPSIPPSLPFEVSAVNLALPAAEQKGSSPTVALPLPPSTISVSAPIAAATSSQSISSGGTASTSSMGGSNSSASISSNGGSTSSMTSAEDAQNAMNQLAKQYTNGELGVPDAQQLRQVLQTQQGDIAPRFVVQEEHWKHHAQARAILGNLIGPNGEQLTSTDPYNTTVFVGGLSPLISEETLRTFFAPFGEIHYVSQNSFRQMGC